MADYRAQQGELLRAAREKAGLRQGEAADRIGVSRPALSGWERGTDTAPDHRISQLAALYGVTADSLVPAGARRARRGRPPEGPGRKPELSQPLRVWLQQFRLELTKDGANDEQIDEAMDLLTQPSIFTYYSGGAKRDRTDEQILTGMQAMAVVIKSRLKDLGVKIR